MPEVNPVQLLLDDIRDMKPKVEEALNGCRELRHTIHGPPGSANGMYGDLRWVKEALRETVLPFVEQSQKEENKGMSRREKVMFILIAAIMSGMVSIGATFITAKLIGG